MSKKHYSSENSEAIQPDEIEEVEATESVNETSEIVVEVPNEIKPEIKKPKSDFCVYIGPTILGVIQKGTIYKGDEQEAKKTIASAIEKYPGIAYLIVNGSDVATKQKEVKTEGNFLHSVYKNIKKK